VKKLYNAFYTSIGVSNQTVEQVDSSRVSETFSQSVKDLAKGSALFVRGLSYFNLVQLYGEVPLKLTRAQSEGKITVTARNPIDSIYKQIVRDLVAAEAILPLYNENKAKPSKGAANAILAKVYLTWAQKPLSQAEIDAIKDSKTDPAHSVDNEKLQKAVEYADKVINSGQYKLLSNFNANFGVLGENGQEHIFTIHHDGDGLGDKQGNHQTHCPFTNRFDLWPDNHIGPADATIPNRFDNADKRKLYSIVTRLYNADERVGTTTPAVYQEYKFEFPLTSPRFGKFIHRNAVDSEIAPGSSAGQPNNINRIEIRYAELLLIKAEALFFLNKASEALPLINQLRARAGVPNLTTLTQDDLFKEWGFELLFEQKNWTNLVRWKRLIQTVQTVDQYEYFKEDYKDVESIEAKFGATVNGVTNYPFFAKIYKHLHAKYDNISGKFYRFPLPAEGALDFGVTPQNPGY
jgi:hypothetical protein